MHGASTQFSVFRVSLRGTIGSGLVFGFRPSSLRNDEVHLDRMNAAALCCSSGSLQLNDSLIFLLLPLLLLVLLPPFS